MPRPPAIPAAAYSLLWTHLRKVAPSHIRQQPTQQITLAQFPLVYISLHLIMSFLLPIPHPQLVQKNLYDWSARLAALPLLETDKRIMLPAWQVCSFISRLTGRTPQNWDFAPTHPPPLFPPGHTMFSDSLGLICNGRCIIGYDNPENVYEWGHTIHQYRSQD